MNQALPEQKTEGKFELIKKTTFKELTEGDIMDLPESDLCFQSEEVILQFKYIKPEEEKKYEIKPGIYNLTESSVGVRPIKNKLHDRELLSTIDNTSKIINEAKVFFSRLHVYEKLKRDKKRGVLLSSKPGLGKTSAIAKFCLQLSKEDPGTVVFNWPTSEVEPEAVSRFLSTSSEYTAECTKLILIIEDIGGGERDDEGHRAAVSSGLLNLLDGVGVTFKLPTFIVATTNHPEALLESLADRPGRFDLMLELEPPSLKEKVALLEFIAKRDITPEEKEALGWKGTENFSIAHLEEIVVRSELHDKTIPAVIKELIAHSLKFKRGFTKEKAKFGITSN